MRLSVAVYRTLQRGIRRCGHGSYALRAYNASEMPTTED